MAGKKGLAGPYPKHGGYLFMRTGNIPREKKYIEIKLRQLKQGLIDSLGGNDVVTTGQLVIINQIVQYSGFVELVNHYLKSDLDGPFYIEDGKLLVQPAITQFYVNCVESIARNISRLGLNKPSKDAMRKYEEKKRLKKKEKKIVEVTKIIRDITKPPPTEEELQVAEAHTKEES